MSSWCCRSVARSHTAAPALIPSPTHATRPTINCPNSHPCADPQPPHRRRRRPCPTRPTSGASGGTGRPIQTTRYYSRSLPGATSGRPALVDAPRRQVRSPSPGQVSRKLQAAHSGARRSSGPARHVSGHLRDPAHYRQKTTRWGWALLVRPAAARAHPGVPAPRPYLRASGSARRAAGRPPKGRCAQNAPRRRFASPLRFACPSAAAAVSTPPGCAAAAAGVPGPLAAAPLLPAALRLRRGLGRCMWARVSYTAGNRAPQPAPLCAARRAAGGLPRFRSAARGTPAASAAAVLAPLRRRLPAAQVSAAVHAPVPSPARAVLRRVRAGWRCGPAIECGAGPPRPGQGGAGGVGKGHSPHRRRSAPPISATLHTRADPPQPGSGRSISRQFLALHGPVEAAVSNSAYPSTPQSCAAASLRRSAPDASRLAVPLLP